MKKLSEIDECIFDPSTMPLLPELKKTKLRKIWIPDDFFRIEDKNELSKLIRPWSKSKFNAQKLFMIIKERKIGKAIIGSIEVDEYYMSLFDKIERYHPTYNENKDDPSRSIKRLMAKKIIGFAHKTKKIIVSKTRKLKEEANKFGIAILDLPNKMIDGKQKFFNEKTRGIVKRSRGWRYIGGVAIGIVTGAIASPIVGIAVGLTFASVDP